MKDPVSCWWETLYQEPYQEAGDTHNSPSRVLGPEYM